MPRAPENLVFEVRGEDGAGKTRFALGIARTTPKKVAILGNDRGAAKVAGRATFGNVVHVPIRDASSLDAALAELEDRREEFGAVIVDSLTDWWSAEQKKHVIEEDGEPLIPPRAWRVIRAEHEDRMRILLSLGVPLILLSEERPLWERDAHLADIRLRLFQKDGRAHAEVLKDRSGRTRMGAVVENPTVELWLRPISSSTTAPALEFVARELIDHLGEIQTADHWKRWRRKHSGTLSALLSELPESRTKQKLVRMRDAKAHEFGSPSHAP